MPGKCADPNCGKPVSRGRLLCGKHWFQLDFIVKAQVRLAIINRDIDLARFLLQNHFDQLRKASQ